MTNLLTAQFRRTPAQQACRTVGAVQMAAGALSTIALWGDAGALAMIGVVVFAVGFVLRYLP